MLAAEVERATRALHGVRVVDPPAAEEARRRARGTAIAWKWPARSRQPVTVAVIVIAAPRGRGRPRCPFGSTKRGADRRAGPLANPEPRCEPARRRRRRLPFRPREADPAAPQEPLARAAAKTPCAPVSDRDQCRARPPGHGEDDPPRDDRPGRRIAETRPGQVRRRRDRGGDRAGAPGGERRRPRARARAHGQGADERAALRRGRAGIRRSRPARSRRRAGRSTAGAGERTRRGRP